MTQPRIEVMPIEEAATLDLLNTNKHTARGRGRSENSMRRRGMFRPIAAAGKGVTTPVIGAGNQTYEIAVDIGIKEAIVVHTRGDQIIINVRDDIEPGSAEFHALSIEDNITALDHNPDVEILAALASGDDAILKALRTDDKILNSMIEGMGLKEESVDAPADVDRAAELLAKWQVVTGDLWHIGAHRLICGDCTDAATVVRVMGGERAQCLLTDPPYNVDYKGNYIQSGKILEEDNKIWEGNSFEDKIENFPEWLNNAYKVFDGFMDNGCAIYIWHPAGAEGRHFWTAWLWDDWHFQVDLVWNKQSLIISRWDYKPQHEPCMYGWKGTNRKWIGENNEPTVWDYPRQQGTAGGKREHPTEKPLPIFERGLRNHSADIVFEPFSGSGTTLVACENLGRRGRAVEISPAYVAVALERMSVAFPDIEIKRL